MAVVVTNVAHGTSAGISFAILPEDLPQEKKNARMAVQTTVSGTDGKESRDFRGLHQDDTGQGHELLGQDYHGGRVG
jgi:hypothetical protein